jgi:hypothetical protein
VRNRKKGPQVHDPARVARQQDLLISIFSQLKEKESLSTVANLAYAADSGVYTNLNLEQTLALVNFAETMDPKDITMHTMPSHRVTGGGALGQIWYFTDQPGRQKLIKEVFGIDVPEQTHCSEQYAHWLGSYGFTGMVYLKTAKQMLDYADTNKATFTDDQQKAYETLKAAYDGTQAAWDKASLTFKSADTNALKGSESVLKTSATALAKLLGYKDKLDWTRNTYVTAWIRDKRINEIPVDLR